MGKTALVRGIRNGGYRYCYTAPYSCIDATCAFPIAPFKDTKSTCGAATCTVTSVDASAGRAWKDDKYSESERILLKKWDNQQHTCRVCEEIAPAYKYSVSENDELGKGKLATCESCYLVGILGCEEFMLCCVVKMN